MDRAFGAFRSAGAPETEIATVTHALWDYVFGAALATDDPDTFADRLMHSAGPSAIPEAAPVRDRVRIGVGALVDGLLSRYRPSE